MTDIIIPLACIFSKPENVKSEPRILAILESKCTFTLIQLISFSHSNVPRAIYFNVFALNFMLCSSLAILKIYTFHWT